MKLIFQILVLDVPILAGLLGGAFLLKRRFPGAAVPMGNFATVGISAIGVLHALLPSAGNENGRDYISAVLLGLMLIVACRGIVQWVRLKP